MVGLCTPFTKFFDFWLCASRYEKDSCQCYYLRHQWLKFFIFQISWKWFPWHLKQECVHLPQIRTCFFRHIGHGQGLETLNVQASRHARIIKKVLKHLTFLVYYDPKVTKIFTKLTKKWKQRKIPKKWNNCLDIIKRLAKFHVSSTCSCLSLSSNVFLRQSQFCGWPFLTKIYQILLAFEFLWTITYFVLIS